MSVLSFGPSQDLQPWSGVVFRIVIYDSTKLSSFSASYQTLDEMSLVSAYEAVQASQSGQLDSMARDYSSLNTCATQINDLFF